MVGDTRLEPQGAGAYAAALAPGRYRVTVRLKDPALRVAEQELDVGSFARAVPLEVLDADQPVITMSGTTVAFRPVAGLVGVTFPPQFPTSAVRDFAAAAEAELGVRRVDPDGGRRAARPGPRLAFAMAPTGDPALLIDRLRALATAAGAGPDAARVGPLQAREPGTSTPQLVVDDQFLLRFTPATTEREVLAWIARLDGRLLRHVDRCPPAVIAALPGHPGERLRQLATLTGGDQPLASAEPALPVPLLPAARALLATQANVAGMGVEAAWNRGVSGAGVTVGLVDTPVATTHPGAQRSGVPWGEHPVLAPTSARNHGTRTFGLISAQGAAGLWGAAPDAWPYAVGLPLGPGGLAGLLESALTLCRDRPCRVVSLSLTYPWATLSSVLSTRLSELAAAGAVVVKAAGNGDAQLGWPSARSESTAPVVRDGLCESTLTVCVADIGADDLPTDSNWGEVIDFCAPGTGSTTLQANGGTGPFGQSSAATALVSATLALVFSAKPSLSRAEALDLLADTADRPGATGWANVVPPWTTSTATRPHHLRYGFGKVNAGRAVDAALV
jgi:subtilisin family serine protease